MFIEEFSHPLARSVRLDKKIINQLIIFLMKDKKHMGAGSTGQTKPHYDMVVLDSSKREALLWLREFIQHFLDDYMAWQKEEDNYLGNMNAQNQKLVEEGKQPLPVPESTSRKFIESIFQKQFPSII